VLVATALAFVPRASRAAAPPTDQERAYELVESAASDRARGDLEAAIEKLKAAIKLYPEPALVYNLGRLYEDTEVLDLAQYQYELCLREATALEVQSRARDGLARVSEARKSGRLLLSGVPDGARLQIDGQPVAAPPAGESMKLPAGPRRLEVSAEGFQPLAITVDVPGGRVLKRTVTLVAATPAPKISHGEPPSEATVQGGATRFGPWPWVTLGVGAAVAATGGALLGLGQADYDTVESADGWGTAEVTGISVADAESLIASGDEKVLAGWTLLGVGSAAVIAGVVLAVLPEAREETAISLVSIPTVVVSERGAIVTLTVPGGW
jgi:tetratricopeptide (TPR) repeat protein